MMIAYSRILEIVEKVSASRIRTTFNESYHWRDKSQNAINYIENMNNSFKKIINWLWSTKKRKNMILKECSKWR